MVVVGLHPSFDVQTLRRQLIARKNDVSEKVLFSLDDKNHSRIEPGLEPHVCVCLKCKASKICWVQPG